MKSQAQLKLFSFPEAPAIPVPVLVRPAQLVDLHAFWPFIRVGLNKIRARLEKHSYWEPEHVYAALVAGRAQLLLALRGEAVVGFTVVTVQSDPFLQVPLSLFVWIAYSEGGGVVEMDDALEALARTQGLRFLEALTARTGLLRRIARHGWYRAMTILRKDLYDERKG